MLGDASSGSNIALRDAVRHVQKSEGKSDNLLLWLSFVYTDIGCDIFLALRLFCLAQLTLACIMFVVLPSPLSRNLGSVVCECMLWYLGWYSDVPHTRSFTEQFLFAM
jgi:hypothetical protein